MKTIEEIFNEGVEQWRLSKGQGTALITPPLDDKYFLLSILQRLYSRSPTNRVLIIVQNFTQRLNLIEFLTHQEDEENNLEFKNLIESKTLAIYTSSFVGYSSSICWPRVLTIVYNVDEYSEHIRIQLRHSHYKLVIINKLFTTSEENVNLYKDCPILDAFKANEVNEIRTSLPVEELWCGIDFADYTQDEELYAYYSKYIETSIRIFGSLDLVQQARCGNSQLNMSAATICNNIARENGWDEHLDMSTPYNRQIDELFNPNSLSDRASKTFEYIRNRSNLITDFSKKLPVILDIVNKNKDKKILIISKRGEFAKQITDYINNMSESDICRDYHDRVDNIPAVDIYGNPLYVKSGVHKGERRYMAAQAQRTLNETLFNLNKINVLSTSSAPDKSLDINVDVVIITSPLCETIKSYLYRLDKINFPNNKIELYTIFVRDTLEERELRNREISENHTILNMCEFSEVGKNNFDFIAMN